jgi:fructosamine-3-kinase
LDLFMGDIDLLIRRLRDVGFAVASVTPTTGGMVAVSGLAALEDGRTIFAKTMPGSGSDLFPIEAEGLRALTELGGASTPEVLLSSPDLLVLEAMRPRGPDADFWEAAGRMLAEVHVTAVGERFGWHHDGWLGRLRQENAWTEDGHEFFARHRILRWLAEPLVEAAFDGAERAALERLCAALPEIVPVRPPVLNHGDLWTGNLVATASGGPTFIDPAVSYTWAESDLSMVWSANRPPVSERFFAAYGEIAPLVDGWQQRMPVLHLREVLSVIAHGDDDWGAVAAVRKVIAPFGRR